eukprot:CAMPEP_0194279534 /NCGR_PEP_ID=MMETSP0169-20130528/13982_1 /TAXON_ID=218684 /ORGANISM="Corethron pennatum, Strain L29A3" /LENGTH=378 /DNA_ID=CAMNT_0039023969 /DNA_START=120 /DNA_END=1256 /DNA_ORIENTATION=-
MHVRLDYAVWGASFVVNAMQRMGIVPKSDPSTRMQYVMMKWVTWTMDYAYMFGMICFLETFMSGKNFTAKNVFLHQVMNSNLVCLFDIIKAISFWKFLPKAKTDHLAMLGRDIVKALFTIEGIKENFKFLSKILTGEGIFNEFRSEQRKSIRHQLWYFFKIGLVAIPGACYLQTSIGMFYWLPLQESTLVKEFGEHELHVSRFCFVYAEFLILSFTRDGLSMNILHQMFHTIFFSHHKTHHLPMKELSVLNAFYFDVPDLIAENVIGPAFLCALKYVFGVEPTLHYFAFFFYTVCDQNVHSLNPYTISFWIPLFDNFMRPNVSHNLHHAINRGHYTIWPLHQIKGVGAPNHPGQPKDGVDFDIMQYNKIFDTSFPCDL